MNYDFNVETSKCPSCKVDLEKIPQRKSKCLHCGLPIYKRTNPETETTILVSEKDLAKVDEENFRFYELRNFIKIWKDIVFKDLNFSLEDYEKIKINSGSPFEKDHL
ncbi:MAG: hypothetical protein Q8K40_09815, partial [Ignavibacteria bacterium]|nr:hypothetical protein [Ignavibacteria bacterium]